MKTVAIIQARMGSTRLPGKVLQNLAGEPMLARCVERVKRAGLIDQVVIATTTLPQDDDIVNLCNQRGYSFFRGSETDVLDRYFQAAKQYQAGIIVRITSDCPAIAPEVLDNIIQHYHTQKNKPDYASNVYPKRSFPRGLDTEVFSFKALEKAWHEDKNPDLREHVTPYIYKNPDIFRTYNVISDNDFSHYRWTVDTPEDLTLMEQIYNHFGNDQFSYLDLLSYFEANPELVNINKHVQQKVDFAK